jgi:ABC-2 type transport system ATP-binding protein
MIQIEQLQVNYGNITALNISEQITINKNDRIGIIGSNGAGKSTFIKAILGLVKYTGKIKTDLDIQSMAVHMQENNYVQTMPVKYIIQAVLNTEIRNNKKLNELIDFFDFSPSLNKKFHTLSGGQKQRLTIILVLMQNTPIIFLDEITSGLDFETRETLMVKLKKWYEKAIKCSGADVLRKSFVTKLFALLFSITISILPQYCSKSSCVLPNATTFPFSRINNLSVKAVSSS